MKLQIDNLVQSIKIAKAEKEKQEAEERERQRIIAVANGPARCVGSRPHGLFGTGTARYLYQLENGDRVEVRGIGRAPKAGYATDPKGYVRW